MGILRGKAQAGSEDTEPISIQMALEATEPDEITKGVHVGDERVQELNTPTSTPRRRGRVSKSVRGTNQEGRGRQPESYPRSQRRKYFNGD